MQQYIYFLEDSEPFYQTAAFHEAKHYLEDGGQFLVLSGLRVCGKTKTSKELYRSVTGRSPKIITDLEMFDCQEQTQAIIYDGAIPGKLSVESLQDKLKTWLENVSICETKTFIIFTSINDQKALFRKIIPVNPGEGFRVMNLNKRLTAGDRTQILHSHFSMLHPNRDFSNILYIARNCKNESLGYPEICALFSRCEYFQRARRSDFCKKPLYYLKMYLEKMYKNKRNTFLLLVYMSLNEMELDVENPDEMLFNGLEACKCNCRAQAMPLDDTIVEIVRLGKDEDINSLMSWEFVDKVPKTSKYRLQHDVIKRMTHCIWNLSF